MSFSIVAVAKLEGSLKFVDRFFELASTVKHQTQIVMSISRRVPLLDCLFQHVGSAVKIAQSRKRVPEIAMGVGKVAVLLLDRRLVSAHRFLNLASRVKSVAKIVVSFGVVTFALSDRGSI